MEQPTPPAECHAVEVCGREAVKLREIMSGRGSADRGYVITYRDAEEISGVITRLMAACLSLHLLSGRVPEVR